MQGLNGNAETHAQPGNNSIADAFLAGKVDAAAQKPLQVSGPLHGRILQPLDAITKSDTKSTTSQLNEFGHPIDLGLVVLEIPTKTRIGDIIPPNFV